MSEGADERVYAFGEDGLFGSSDGGTTWRRLRSASQWLAAVDPADGRHLLAFDAVVGLVGSRDGGRTFVPSSEGFTASSIGGLVFLPSSPGVVLAGGYGFAGGFFVFRSTDGGSTWTEILRRDSYHKALVVDAGGDRVYLYTDLGLEVSSDAGDSWQFLPLVTSVLAVDRTIPRRLWATNGDSVQLSEDGGVSWREVGRPLSAGGYFSIHTIEAAFGRVYLGVDGGELWRSADDGGSWLLLDGDPSQLAISSLTADPRHAGRLWLTSSSLGVFVGDFSD
jgi:photosystem II stability/assembly factor-like uncharacterized protein